MRFRPPAWLADGFVRCPAVPIACAMMVGIGIARTVLPVMPWTTVLIGGVLLLIALILRRHAWVCSLALLISVSCAAAAATHVALFRFAPNDIGLYASEDPRFCRLRLYLSNEPRLRTVPFGSRLRFPPTQTTLATVREVLTRDGWRPATGEVLLQVREVVPDLAAGQTIEVWGRLDRPGIAMNPGQFDWQHYYREQGITCSVQVRRAHNLSILDRSTPPLLTRWREACRAMLSRGFPADRSLDQALVAALVLGDYDPELRDVKETFRETGTSHHLAISGMHIAVVGGVVFLALRLLAFRPRTCWMLAMAFIGLYAAAAMPSPPVIRSVILFAVAGTAVISGRITTAVHLLALTVAVMMAIHPPDLSNAGFQLSFGTVLGLILLSGPLAMRLAKEEDILLPDEIERLPTRTRIIRWLDRWNLQVWCAGIIAWLVSMPLVAMHFTRLNPWQVLGSIALGPIVTMTLLAGVFKIIGTFFCPPIAPALAWIAAESSAAMRWTVDQLARLPFSSVPLASPSMTVVAFCWIALALAVTRWKLPSIRIGVDVLALTAFAYLALGPSLFGTHRTLEPGQTRITLMAVGAGQCALIEQAGGRTVMIDCGSTSLADLTLNVVHPLLREYGITRIDTIFISHANSDHYSGVAEISAAYDVREIVVAHGFEPAARLNGSGYALMEQLAAIQTLPRIAKPGDRIPLGRDTHLDVLWPPTADFSPNDGSLVLRLVKNKRSVLFTGDIESAGLRGLMADGVPRSDVLIAPHHGSSEPETADFINAVSPTWIAASNRRSLTGTQIRFDALTQHRRVMRTHEYGAVTIVIDADGELRVDGFVKSASP